MSIAKPVTLKILKYKLDLEFSQNANDVASAQLFFVVIAKKNQFLPISS